MRSPARAVRASCSVCEAGPAAPPGHDAPATEPPAGTPPPTTTTIRVAPRTEAKTARVRARSVLASSPSSDTAHARRAVALLGFEGRPAHPLRPPKPASAVNRAGDRGDSGYRGTELLTGPPHCSAGPVVTAALSDSTTGPQHACLAARRTAGQFTHRSHQAVGPRASGPRKASSLLCICCMCVQTSYSIF